MRRLRYNRAMARERRSDPMPVKHWSFAGLILTYWCNAHCASCYLRCDEGGGDEMSVEQALGYWASLAAASPHGCRIHLSGGEPFGDWPRLIEICRRAQQEGLGPLQKVETNAFWAGDETLVRRRLADLDGAGMERLSISADPYHQQFVPIERCRLLARVAEDVLGGDRVQVRWRDWLADGFDTASMDATERDALFAKYAAAGRDRYNGRAGDSLAAKVERKLLSELADNPCAQSLLTGRHVHVDGGGRVMPGTCAGIVLGVLGPAGAADVWRRLDGDFAERAVVGTLAKGGPVGLLQEACSIGYQPRESYAGKCHLCWEVRRHMALAGRHEVELGPRRLYEPPAGRWQTSG